VDDQRGAWDMLVSAGVVYIGIMGAQYLWPRWARSGTCDVCGLWFLNPLRIEHVRPDRAP